MKIIIGLGNPGEKYENTRHNIGFAAVSNFKFQVSSLSDWKLNKKFNAEISEGKLGDEKIVLLRPMTFMNNSGQAVKGLMSYLKIKHDELLVVVDDFALPLGKMRLRTGGSAGGHNGMASISAAMGGVEIARIKIGIGPRPPRTEAKDFVLGRFSKEEEAVLAPALERGLKALLAVLGPGVDEAMNLFNYDKPVY